MIVCNWSQGVQKICDLLKRDQIATKTTGKFHDEFKQQIGARCDCQRG